MMGWMSEDSQTFMGHLAEVVHELAAEQPAACLRYVLAAESPQGGATCFMFEVENPAALARMAEKLAGGEKFYPMGFIAVTPLGDGVGHLATLPWPNGGEDITAVQRRYLKEAAERLGKRDGFKLEMSN